MDAFNYWSKFCNDLIIGEHTTVRVSGTTFGGKKHASCKCWQVSIKESCCLLRSFCVYESAENELKENNNGSWIFF